jgi:DNA modification methylase
MSIKKDAVQSWQTNSIKRFENQFLQGDALGVLRKLPNESVDSVVTSPPYFTSETSVPKNKSVLKILLKNI